MTRVLHRRGPDAEGLLIDSKGGAGLGHRRLSIIDLGGGRQPMSSADDRVHAVVNGEIYNFKELRQELKSLGHIFKSNSDSEVVLHGYVQWGLDMVRRLDGMFALAVWDCASRKLLLARDRMGKKPLYYAFVGPGRDTLIFASELKALAAHPDLDREIEPSALAAYLSYECLPEDKAIYRQAHKLPPATVMVFDQTQCRSQFFEFWKMNFQNEAIQKELQSASEEDIAQKLRDRIQAATRARLVSDVPLGVFLSGGLDSSVVAAAMAKERAGKDIKTFSIAFEDPSFDESSYARKVAKHLNTDHHEERLSPEVMIDILPEVGAFMCEPIGDASIIPTYLLSRFARKTVTVALGGDGGDELFLGYPTFQADRVAQKIDAYLPRALQASVAKGVLALSKHLPVSHKNFSLDFKIKRFAQGLGYQADHRHQAWMGSFLPHEIEAVLGENIREKALGQSPYALIADLRNRTNFRDSSDQLVYQYARLYLAGCVLVKVDRASMACGLEVRAPLLDTALVDFATALPGHLKLSGMNTKYILKKAARPWLPADIIDRPKKGFGIPVGAWLRGPLKSFAHELLSSQQFRQSGYFDASRVRQLLEEHDSGKADHRKPLWTLLAFALWHSHYGASARATPLVEEAESFTEDDKGLIKC